MFGYFTAGANQNDNISNNPHEHFSISLVNIFYTNKFCNAFGTVALKSSLIVFKIISSFIVILIYLFLRNFYEN